MFTLYKNNSAFFIPYFVFLLAGAVALLLWSKPEIHHYINRYHAPVFDTFFKYYTNIGLGWLIIPVALALSFVRLRYVIIALVGFLMVFIINDSIKQLAATPRPIEVFSDLNQSIYLVPGVQMYSQNSFPSGHSAIAFCLFCIVALCTSSKPLKFISFIIAALVAYSRMYLSLHFLIDVYFGSVVGVICAIIVYSVGMKLAWLNKFSRIDKPVINLHKAK
jgi:membrane-associated phospholipid phosphatase